jgi:hypothetical protein
MIRESLEVEFSCEDDDSDEEWYDEGISGRLENDFFKMSSSSSKSDILESKGRPQFYTGTAPKTLRLKQAILKKAAKGTSKITSFFKVIKNMHH